MLESLRRRVLENPLIGKELSTGLTSPRLGAVFSLVSAVFVGTDIICYLFFYFGEAGELGTQAGAFLHFWHCIVAYCVLGLLLPIRLVGHIEGARSGRAFDQVVVTGVSPLRLSFGNWGLGLFYAFVLLFVTFPFQMMAYMFGGITFGQILVAYGVLLVYSNLIIAMTLGLSVVTSEWVVMIMMVVVLGFIGIISAYPLVPAVIAEVGPVRFVLRQALSTQLLTEALPHQVTEAIQTSPRFFFVDLPPALYRGFLWACLMTPYVMLIALGPNHFFLPGFNVFGSVVLPGDSKRSRLRRLRHGLVRRIEMAFYYENRPDWCERWDYPLRIAVSMLQVVLIWGVTYGLAYSYATVRNRLEDDVAFHAAFVISAVVLFLWLLAVGQTRLWALFRVRVGRFEVTRAALLNLAFFVLFGVFLAVEATAYQFIMDARSNVTVPSGFERAFDSYGEQRLAYVGVCAALFLNIYVLSRVLAWVFLNGATWRTWVFFLTNALLWGPIVIHEITRRNVFQIVPQSFGGLVYLSPFTILELEGPLRDRFANCMIAHAILSVVLGAIGIALWRWLREGARWPSMPTRQTRRVAPRAGALLVGGLSLLWSVEADAQLQPPPPVARGPGGVLELSGSWSVEGDLPVRVVELIRGFDGRGFTPMTDFMTIVLENRDAETLTGRMRVRVPRNDWNIGSWQPFELPTRTKVPLRFNFDGRYWGSNSLSLELESEKGRLRVDEIPPAVTVPQTAVPGRLEDGGRFLIVSDTPQRPIQWERAMTGGSVVYILSRPLCLPENWRSYAETSAVLLDSPDFSRWTAGQRLALYEYVRLGGSVVFFGRIDVAKLAASPLWGRWFDGARMRSADGPQGRFEFVEFGSGSRTVLDLEGDAGEPAPLLTMRGVGVGRVGYLTFDPTAIQLPVAANASTKFWATFTSRLPKSVQPLAFGPGWSRNEQHLNNPGTLYIIFGYFALYCISIGPGLFIWFRSKARRRYLWRYTLGVCALFSVGIYGLDWIVHTQPSVGEIREVILFGRDSDDAVAYATVRLRSCGRQRHSLELEGTRVSSFEVSRDYQSRTLVPRSWLRRPVLDDAAARGLSLNLAPWSPRALALLGETSFRTGVSGKAEFDARMQLVEFTIQSTVEPLGRRFLLLTYNLNGKGVLKSHTVRPATCVGLSQVRIAVSAGDGDVRGSPAGTGGSVTTSTTVFKQNWNTVFRLGGPSAPRAMIAWESAEIQPGVGLSSGDVVFQQDGTVNHRGIPYREYREFRRLDTDEPSHLLHQQLIVQEIELEVR